MDDRVRYKCQKCGREILILRNSNPPICCQEKMKLYLNKEDEEKLKKDLKIFGDEKPDEDYLVDLLKSKP